MLLVSSLASKICMIQLGTAKPGFRGCCSVRFCTRALPFLPPEDQQRIRTLQELKEYLAQTISSSCSSLDRLRQVHAQATCFGVHCNPYIRSLFITTYASFHDLQAAFRAFNDHLLEPRKTLVWNSLIRGCFRNHQPRLVIDIYQHLMDAQECVPDVQTFNLVITACADLSDFEYGARVHSHAKARDVEFNVLVGAPLISMYCKAGDLQTARHLFDGMPAKDVVSWNALFAGYARLGSLYEVMGLFRDMRMVYGMSPSEATIVSLIFACGNLGSRFCGEAVHAYVIESGFGIYQVVCNALIEMYIKFGCLSSSARIFDGLSVKDCVSWSTMIGGFVHNERPDDALALFNQMLLSEHIKLTRPILLNTILACAATGDLQEGRKIEGTYIIGSNGLESDIHLSTALIYMYAKCGEMGAAFNLLSSICKEKEDVIVWNAMVKACTELRRVDEASRVLLEMLRRGVVPNDNTFLLLISLFSSLSMLKKGMEAHACVVKRGFESEISVANALIDMYGKCGSYDDSYNIFCHILNKNVISWSSIIKSGAWNGKEMEAINLFELMMETKIEPNHVTFVAVLSACSQAGFLDKGREIFENIKEKHGLEPTLEQYSCMIDLFGRAGRLAEAYELIATSEIDDYGSAALWGSLLSACRLCGDWVTGEAAFQKLFCLEPSNAANYLMLAQVYTLAGRTGDANCTLSLIREKPVRMHLGCSWLDCAGNSH